MRVDNDGEGGILALMSLLGVKRQQRPVIVAVGLFGAALIYGDGAITPAISVLSALEGLDIATPAVHRYVLPAAVVILVALFAVQRLGTARIGGAFGPLMAIWFAVIALLGHRRHRAASGGAVGDQSALRPALPAARRHDRVPGARRRVPVRHRGGGAVCRHGAFRRAADPAGVVGGRAAGAGAELCRPGGAGGGRRRRPRATSSTASRRRRCWCRWCCWRRWRPIIASQSIITGAFSMTRQAIQLGWLPRLPITQTSAEGYGQIYVGAGELAADAGDGGADARVRQVRQPRRRLRHRGVGHDADDDGAAVHRHARDLALEPAGRRRGGRRAGGGGRRRSSPPTC